MSNNRSATTKAYAFRLKNEVGAILEKRVKRGKGRWKTVNAYIRDRIEYDARRKR